jgi:4-hydroxy-2-oxoheptanedioate aldolase
MSKTIKQRLSEPGLIRVIAVGRAMHHNLLQIVGVHGGYHGFWIDFEHIGIGVQETEIAAMAARAHGMDTFCRIPPTDYALVTRCLETGASGVMAAQIFSAEQAEEFVRWAKFAPRGMRGLNVGGIDAGFARQSIPEFIKSANEKTFVAIQIETKEGLADCEAIAAIDGVDLLFVGPSDLSQHLGHPGDFLHETNLAALDKVAAACRDTGKHWGAVCITPEHGRIMLEKGVKMLSPASDVKLINAGLAKVQADFAKLFEDNEINA